MKINTTMISVTGKGMKLIGYLSYFYLISFLSLLILSPEKKVLLNGLSQSKPTLILLGIGILSSMLIVGLAFEKAVKYMKSTWTDRSWHCYGKLSLDLSVISLFMICPFYLIGHADYLSRTVSPFSYLISIFLLFFIATNRLTTFNNFIKSQGN